MRVCLIVALSVAALGLGGCGGGDGSSGSGDSGSRESEIIAYTDLPENVQQFKMPDCDKAHGQVVSAQSTLDELIDAVDEADTEGGGQSMRQGVKTATEIVAMYKAANPSCFEASEVLDSDALLHLAS